MTQLTPSASSGGDAVYLVTWMVCREKFNGKAFDMNLDFNKNRGNYNNYNW